MRCTICGSKECCGGELEQRIAELEEQIKKLEAEKSASVECDENWIEAYQQRYAKLDE